MANLELDDLEQLVAFEELGSFSKVARRFFVSTPTVTRAMARVEEGFGAALFDRDGNRATLSETGRVAVESARRVLREAASAVAEVQEFERGLTIINVASCAPAPLWELLPMLSRLYPGMSVTSCVRDTLGVEATLADGACDVAVLPYRPDAAQAPLSRRLLDEHLQLCVRSDHPLAGRESVALADLNGFNFLLGSDLGFWNRIVRDGLPASRFLVQDDSFSLTELIRTSSLPCFTTDVSLASRYRSIGEDRACVPIADPEVNVTFWLAGRDEEKVGRLFR
ncbi:LysR family transcriptional regulator [Paratractidigestivibacter sp.]|uniref:LysR family transcriptional regulator n=1 Tax=Paratractidigestivibacter sp. TaxID=2847316 RepID=UPI002ABD4A8D|nr:LysR family transcriptional regulator [Paratractidigestivibacter sp.]